MIAIDHRATAPTNVQLVGDHIRTLILERRLRPGDRIVGDRVAAELGVSRVPVREALRQLDGTGLVTFRDRRGAVVVGFDRSSTEELLELMEARRAVEPWIAARAAERHQAADLRRIDGVLRAGSAALRSGSGPAVGRAHHDLLAAVARAAHNRPMAEAVEPLHNRTVLAFSLVSESTLPDGWPSHQRVRDAIAARDGSVAARETRHHIDAVTRAIHRHPDLWVEP